MHSANKEFPDCKRRLHLIHVGVGLVVYGMFNSFRDVYGKFGGVT
jgi:hypothetical protein